MKPYPAKIWKESNGSYSVEFPDLPGCFSWGETLEDAKEQAKEALNAYLESLDSRSQAIPSPSKQKGKDIYHISPDIHIAFAITLKQEREKQGLTQKEVAEKMGVAWSAYQRIENPKKTNPTLTTIDKLQKVLGRKFLNLVE